MILNQAHKLTIINAIIADFQQKSKQDHTYSQTKHSVWLDINTSSYSRIIKGETERVISESAWLMIAQRLNVDLDPVKKWITANTATYVLINTQLEVCQQQSTTGIFCDEAGIGKTHAGKEYARRHVNAVYIDGSQYKSKHKLIRAIAREFGVDYKGKLQEVYDRLCSTIQVLNKPLIIIDEAGDVDYNAFLELKALYNATEFNCGLYLMGANGLRVKMDRLRANGKVGYEEIFDRFGASYQSITDDMEPAHVALLKRTQVEQVLAANLPKVSAQQCSAIMKESANNLRKLRKEIIKHKNAL